MAQIKPPQTDESKAPNRDHLMPGLIPQIVDHFTTPRKNYTTRGTSRAKDVSEVFVTTALFRDLYERVSALEGRPKTREFGIITGGRRTA